MLFYFFNTVVFVIKEILHTVSIVACSTLAEMGIEKESWLMAYCWLVLSTFTLCRALEGNYNKY